MEKYCHICTQGTIYGIDIFKGNLLEEFAGSTGIAVQIKI